MRALQMNWLIKSISINSIGINAERDPQNGQGVKEFEEWVYSLSEMIDW